MDTIVMKNIYFRYDTRYITDCWILDVIIVPVEGEKEMVRDVHA